MPNKIEDAEIWTINRSEILAALVAAYPEISWPTGGEAGDAVLLDMGDGVLHDMNADELSLPRIVLSDETAPAA